MHLHLPWGAYPVYLVYAHKSKTQNHKSGAFDRSLTKICLPSGDGSMELYASGWAVTLLQTIDPLQEHGEWKKVVKWQKQPVGKRR